MGAGIADRQWTKLQKELSHRINLPAYNAASVIAEIALFYCSALGYWDVMKHLMGQN